jgi:hypothetical protein
MQLFKPKEEPKAQEVSEEGILVHVDSTESTKAPEAQARPLKVSNKRGPRIRHEEGASVPIRVNILEATRRKLAAAAGADAVKFQVIVERALMAYTAPAAPAPTFEQELIRLLPQVDRNLVFRLEKHRSNLKIGWAQMVFQGLELLRRELDGEPLRAELPRSIRPSQDESGITTRRAG